MILHKDDPRLSMPQCHLLTPVVRVHANPYFAVHDRAGYYTVDAYGPQVIVLPVVEKDNLVLVRVKRPVLEDSPLELPAGGARKGELPVRAALRELAEETGIRIENENRMESRPPLAGDPNRNPCLSHVYRLDLSRREFERRQGHDKEIVEVVLMDRKSCMEAVGSGEIYVTTPLALICRDFLCRTESGKV